MAECEERIEKGMSTINDAEGLGASILYSLQNGDIVVSELASKAGIGQSTKDKLNKEVVYQLIQAYLSSDTSVRIQFRKLEMHIVPFPMLIMWQMQRICTIIKCH